MAKIKIAPGDKFNRWTVIRQEGNYRGKARYLCRCDCGATNHVLSSDLVYGRSRSCVSCSRKKENPYSQTKLYGVWNAMRNRCNRNSDKNFHNYGERGISVCEEWNDFLAFQAWSLENGYREGLSIDRIDNDGNYCPENCRWVTQKVQANNSRNVHWITYGGETKTLSEWAARLGLTPHGLLGRLKNHPVEKALSTSKTKGGRWTTLAKGD